ncbi:hypothetical protein COY28_03150 [Candidatus Woesearchaeota archaeon CG_4_10_14_0_2_um_filter_57_5]|nr:MAG: hypothetical protein AUJ68_04045 [Candidatus Woesearchaeota archaeon CG1_02_57_44]PIN67824.1 MAG: hypothetical protein COV94_06650 [Candidatus Woesearchaeota archaeon CG11_big_fil_rev_8_21_14_0_20_57_5]PIZ53929.1 MAG: hypothetical protein COY28_03150 [Candidatus Woesearchaeota archaeon CG_4_10_14_0_2_um_filter_57_5]
MAEKEIIADNLQILYEGPVDPPGFINFVTDFAQKNGFSKTDAKMAERVTEDGRNMELKYVLNKRMNDYLVKQIYVIAKFTNLKKLGKSPKILMQGKVKIILDGWIVTDLEHRYEMKPSVSFVRAVLEKFVTGHHLDKYRSDVAADTNRLHAQLKAFLNLHRYEPRELLP